MLPAVGLPADDELGRFGAPSLRVLFEALRSEVHGLPLLGSCLHDVALGGFPCVPSSCSYVSASGAVTGRGVSRVGYQTAEAMVVRKGFSVEQLRECLEEYADLSVVQVSRVSHVHPPFLVGALPSPLHVDCTQRLHLREGVWSVSDGLG